MGETAASPPAPCVLDEAHASFASQLLFGWAFPLLKLGARRPLEAADLGEVAPCDRAGDAWPVGVAQPGTMLDLAVAGNESKPGLATRSEWNRELSRAFLRTAVEGYAEDASDGEGELGAKARTMRIKVIQAMGGDVASVFLCDAVSVI